MKQRNVRIDISSDKIQSRMKKMTENDKATSILASPVFIVGAARSGTTWLQRLLVEHSDVTGGQESEFFLYFSKCLNVFDNESKAQRKLGLSTYWNEADFFEAIMTLWAGTFNGMLKIKPGASILTEKTPSHALHMPTILKFLPKARFIHIIRDSRACVASMRAAEKSWGKSWAPKSVRKASIKWRKSVIAATKIGRKLPTTKYIEVYYEDLLCNSKEELARIYNFLEIDYDNDLLEEIISKQNISNQKKFKGTGLKDYKGIEIKEPDGFIRKGKSDSWKEELNIYQKLVVWFYTAHTMRECRYDWNGRMNFVKE